MSRLGQEVVHEIVHRHSLGQSVRGIARAMHVSRRAVQRVLDKQATDRQQPAPHPDMARRRCPRGSALDAHAEAISVFLNRYPNITVVRLLEELRPLGYRGGYTVLRERVKELRSQTSAALVQRFETAPGMQAQMDWAVYTIDFSAEGRRRVNLFSYVLGYSRRQYLHFTESQDFETLLREHVRAFEHLGGVAATCLYDNMKTVVDRWEGGGPVYNVRFLSFAAHWSCWASSIARASVTTCRWDHARPPITKNCLRKPTTMTNRPKTTSHEKTSRPEKTSDELRQRILKHSETLRLALSCDELDDVLPARSKSVFRILS